MKRIPSWVFILTPIALILFCLYRPTLGFPFRGEHWSLLHFFVAPFDWLERLGRIATFACADSNRIQPIAFFIPYLNFLAFGDSALAHQLFCFILHGGCIYWIIKILEEFEITWPAQLMAAVFFGISYTYSDILNWSFYSYVFFHAFMILSSFYFLLRWLKTNLSRFLWFHFSALILASWAYESGIGLFAADALAAFFIFERSKIKEFFRPLLISGAITLAPFVVYYILQGKFDPHTNTTFHLGILVKVFSLLKQAFYNGAGFIRPAIIQKIVYAPAPPPEFSSLWSLLILAASGVLTFVAIGSFKKFLKHDENRILGRSFLIYIGLALFFYTFIISFGRVWPQHYQQGAKYFEVQMRYYYVPMALASLAFFIPIGWACKKKSLAEGGVRTWLMAAIPLLFVVSGNAYNIASLNRQLAQPMETLNRHLASIQGLCRDNNSDNASCRVQRFFADHYNYRIPGASQSPYRMFIYNANYCETPARTYRSGFSLPPQTSTFDFSGARWNILSSGAPEITAKNKKALLKTHENQRAVLFSASKPAFSHPSSAVLSWKMFLRRGPRWDYNGSSAVFHINSRHAIQIAFFENYLELILDGAVQEAIPLPIAGNWREFSLRVTPEMAALSLDGRLVYEIPFPAPQPLEPSVYIGDASAEPGENLEMEISDLKFNVERYSP